MRSKTWNSRSDPYNLALDPVHLVPIPLKFLKIIFHLKNLSLFSNKVIKLKYFKQILQEFKKYHVP